MSVKLLVGPVGSGKTGRILQRFKQFSPLEHQDSVRLIVPTLARVLSLRRFILSDPTFPGLLGDPICTFERLAAEMIPNNHAKPISAIQKRMIVQQVARTSGFKRIRQRPSFASALSRTIDDLITSGITQEDLLHAVKSADRELPESSVAKMENLLDAYKAYRRALDASHLCEREDILNAAVQTDAVGLECVMIDGFLAFTPSQQELIRCLAGRCSEMWIALDCGDPPSPYLTPAMEFLESIPGIEIERLRVDSKSAPTCVRQADSPSMEAEVVAGEIERLMREGVRPAEIAVSARSLRPYYGHIDSAFREHGIPVGEGIRPLGNSALARHVLRAVEGTDVVCMDDLRKLIDGMEFEWPDQPEELRRETAAWRSIRRILAEVADAEAVIGKSAYSNPAKAFKSAVREGIFRMGNAEGVALAGMEDIGGRKLEAVFVMGLVDGMVPRSGRDDPLLPDWEREILNAHLPNSLRLSRDSESFERCLFDHAMSAGRETYLSHPRTGRPSPYIGGLRTHAEDILPAIERAETLRALTHRTILDLCTSTRESDQYAPVTTYNRLLEREIIGPRDFEWLGHEPQEVPASVHEALGKPSDEEQDDDTADS